MPKEKKKKKSLPVPTKEAILCESKGGLTGLLGGDRASQRRIKDLRQHTSSISSLFMVTSALGGTSLYEVEIHFGKKT